MKKVILLLTLLPYVAAGQVIDDFEQGLSMLWVRSSPERWEADTSGALTGRMSLHHVFDNPESGTDMASISLDYLHPDEGVTSWSFSVRHGYDPSSSNNWSVFLMSDSPASGMLTDGSVRGFLLGVNATGYDDTLRLWKSDGTGISEVLNCRVNWQKDVGTAGSAFLTVVRDPDGIWKVETLLPDSTLRKSGEALDADLFPVSWFGIYYRYSSTRDRLLWMDDICVEGVFYRDATAPGISEVIIAGRRFLELSLNEKPDSSFSDCDNFSLNGSDIIPVSVTPVSETGFLLEFGEDFLNRQTNQLFINALCDAGSNCTEDTTIVFTPVWAERGDIIITEIMADPSPAVSLPDAEYIEIMNRSSTVIVLEDWSLGAGDQEYRIPFIDVGPGEMIILCHQSDTSLLSRYGKAAGMKQFPLLNDDGRLLTIKDTCGTLIHGIEYSDSWYGSDLKSGGGWSLEMIDVSYPFYYEGNWTASASGQGGSPGTVNPVATVNRDRSFRGPENIFPEGKNTLRISFYEPVPGFTDAGSGVIEGGPSVTEARCTDPLFREFMVSLSAELEYGRIYEFMLDDAVRDIAGNMAQSPDFIFGLASEPAEGDIMFNEILFNPLPGDPDFIEFHNNSQKTLDAADLMLVNIDSEIHDTSGIFLISETARCILPGSYYAVTTSEEKLLLRYPEASERHIFQVKELPSMPDDEGTLLLLSRRLDLIDRLEYSDKMHNSLLDGTEGISLEKIGVSNPSGIIAGWHSAAEASGWATPGAPNSVASISPDKEELVALSSTRISPDNDGFEDYLNVYFNPGKPGNILSIKIFDESGSYVREIASNLLTGPETSVLWNGTDDDGNLLYQGIYILLITWYSDDGSRGSTKKICSLLR